jgi:putative chitinase
MYLFGDDRLVQHPELLEQPEYAIASACWFWNSRKLSDIADVPEGWTHTWKGNVYDHFQWITIRINGGLNGYSRRLQYYTKAKAVLKNAA